MDGSAVHAGWVEVVDHEQICYQMGRNNPVWRAYLKKIIEIQIDAGVHGVHLDECELPITAIGYGGCFCKDCMKQFREYLLERQAKGNLPKELLEMDLVHFEYGQYLAERNIEYPGKPGTVPFFTQYFQFQMKVTTKYFKQMTDHIREYGKSKGREVLVSAIPRIRSGNFNSVQLSKLLLEGE
jgi:beta-galactosidase GanA